ncbi:MAG: hypothetical protein J7513_14615 [Solirubrobacteraceae bacterium]|nr:hypothetical protein [Solirubrobacteraceae bacterium]
MSVTSRWIGLAALACGLTMAIPGAAEAAPLRAYGKATVQSVDGPGQLTIRAGKRTLAVRLYFIDLPRPGECGAAEATRALRGFVRRAHGTLRYELVQTYDGDPRPFARDADGRYPVAITYRSDLRELGADLIAADWARPGMPPAELAALRRTDADVSGEDLPGRRGDEEAPRARRGVWALCGGRLHLPLGQPVPATAPAPWSVDEHGITSAVGPITLSPTLAPESTLTLDHLAAAAPVELTRFALGCRAWAPALQIRVWIYSDDADCHGAPISAIRSAGPEPAAFSRGGAVGDLTSALPSRFPAFSPSTSTDGFLSGSGAPQWAWQTQVLAGRDRRISGVATYAAPPASDG